VAGTVACASSNGGSTNVPSTTPATVSGSTRGVIPVGQELDVRLQQPLSSASAKVEDRFETTTVVDLKQDGRVLIPAGSTVRGQVTSVSPAGKIDRSGKLTVAFDRLTIGGRNCEIRAMATGLESKGIREEGGNRRRRWRGGRDRWWHHRRRRGALIGAPSAPAE
jgi:hypothetical protein